MSLKYDRPDYSPEKTEVVLRPNLLFPSGKLLLYDDFESPVIKWVTGGVGAETVELSTTNAFGGSSSMKLKPGGTSGNNAYITQYLEFPRSKKVGFECKLMLGSGSDFTFDLALRYGTGTKSYVARIKYVVNDDVWVYLDSDGNYSTIPSSAQVFSGSFKNWQHIKMVVDFNTGKYVSFQSNDLLIDMKNLEMSTTDVVVPAHFYSWLMIETQANVSPTTYIDDVVITEE